MPKIKPTPIPEPIPEPLEETVRITGPNCVVEDHIYEPGVNATIPVDLAAEWKESIRARTPTEDER